MSYSREEFEQAVTDKWSDSYSFTRFGDEDYYDEVLEGMWWGWQASRQVDGESVAYITERKLEWLKSGLVLSAVVYRKHSEGSIPLYTHPASAQKEIERLQARVAELCDLIKYAQVKSGACMCGDNMQDHNQASGHSPVDVWDHAVEQVDKGGISEAFILRKQAEAVEYEIISLCGDLRKSKYRGISVKELLHESVSRSSKIRNKAKKFDDQ